MRLMTSRGAVRVRQGDTIIEVVLAVTIFSMVAIGSLTLMNRGSAAAQTALEVTLVRQQMDAQAEVIRYIHAAYVDYFRPDKPDPTTGTAAEWIKFRARSVTSPSPLGQLVSGRCPPSPPTNAFVVNARQAVIWWGTPGMNPALGGAAYPRVRYSDINPVEIQSALGIWVEAVRNTPAAGQAGFVDFHIRACWDSPNSATPITLGTIVRLYEPR